MKTLLSILFLLLSGVLAGQDSTKTLSEIQVMEIVKQFHPVARQAEINIKKAKAGIVSARGLFDPTLSASRSNKTFDGTEYYDHLATELSIPTWYGIELSAGLENLSGSRTDPQSTLGRTNFAGVTVPLAKNLVMDKRRAALQQAKIYQQLSEVEKRTVVNDLLLDAMQAYWHWVQQYEVMKVVSDAVVVNEKRFELVKIGFLQGDRPAIDTVEAMAQLQHFRLLLNESQLQFQNAGLELSAFLWTKQVEPVILPLTVTPDTAWKKTRISESSLPVLEEMVGTALNNHPDLLQYNFKLDALNVERKLKFQEFLPEVKFRYNQLGKGYEIIKSATAPVFENNYRYGISFEIPLRLSKGRGEYRTATLRIQETELERVKKTLSVRNKVQAYYNELLALQKQAGIQEQQYASYLALQRGEEIRFFNGESSLFLVNSRENKTLESMQKLVELETKYYKTIRSLYWAGGVLGAISN